MIKPFARLVAQDLNLPPKAVENTLALLDEGCTVPFIARYRKERTGSLDEVQIGQIQALGLRYEDLQKRKDTILRTIEAAGKLTADIKQEIDNCWESAALEDIYLPFKPKRRTRASIAKEKGLLPLAEIIMLQKEGDVRLWAKDFISDKVCSIDEALQGAKDIISESVSEDKDAREAVRNVFRRTARIVSKAVKAKAQTEEAQKFSDYFDFSEPLKRSSAHRILAMLRGQKAGCLRIAVEPDEEMCQERLLGRFVKNRTMSAKLQKEAVEDAFKRLIEPSIETEFINLSKAKADDGAIEVFKDNLRQLLLSPILGEKRVMAIDPGFRTGCKVVCLDERGNLLHHEAIFPHPPKSMRMQAKVHCEAMIGQYGVEAIAIGNGTASRETVEFVESLSLPEAVKTFVVSEDGASIYSASEVARREFPTEDVTVRGAVSIGRRLMDPLAELVKIDAKNLGVGQYQHDVDQTKLKLSLDNVVESCVNSVGVNLNTASRELLTYVSGLGPALAQNIVDYRTKNGAFQSRNELKKVPRLGAVAYQQASGFLRIQDGKNPLDNTAVHPERYSVVELMAKDQGLSLQEFISSKEKYRKVDLKRYVTEDVGLPTLQDILTFLDKRGRDEREKVDDFAFSKAVHTVDDVQEGMVLPGIVTNITAFGCFVDIGVHQDGLVHISQVADHFVKDITKVVRLHEHVMVRVIGVDLRRGRISLSMKGI